MNQTVVVHETGSSWTPRPPRPTSKGDSAHARYNHQQKLSVLQRLSRGLVIPRVAEPEGDAE